MPSEEDGPGQTDSPIPCAEAAVIVPWEHEPFSPWPSPLCLPALSLIMPGLHQPRVSHILVHSPRCSPGASLKDQSGYDGLIFLRTFHGCLFLADEV